MKRYGDSSYWLSMTTTEAKGEIGYYNEEEGYGRLLLDNGHVVDFTIDLWVGHITPTKRQRIQASFLDSECYNLTLVRPLHNDPLEPP